jgi:hypothetical protein
MPIDRSALHQPQEGQMRKEENGLFDWNRHIMSVAAYFFGRHWRHSADRYGGSLEAAIPKETSQHLNLRLGDHVEYSIQGGKVVVDKHEY